MSRVIVVTGAASGIGREPAALAWAAELAQGPAGTTIYSSTKEALSQWVRRNAPTTRWAGTGVPLNAVAPGVIRTPMTADLLTTPEAVHGLEAVVPMPLGGVAEPIVVAHLLASLVGVDNTHLCGQVVFVDGGSDAIIRGDSTW